MSRVPVRGMLHGLASRSASVAVDAMLRPMISWLARRESFRSMPARLLVSEPPVAADLIHVLGGSSDGSHARIDHGIELHRRGFAPRLLLTGSEWSTDWARWNRDRAVACGVPTTAVITDPGPLSTRSEARALRRLVRRMPIRSVLLVTEAYHAGRAARVFARALRGDGVRVHCCPAPAGDFPPPRWWENPELRERLIGEAFRIALARATGGA